MFFKYLELYCNIFDQRIARQQLCKHGPTRNNRKGCFLYRPRWAAVEQQGFMKPVLNNGAVNTLPRKRWRQQR
jgi:hypothetical protein